MPPRMRTRSAGRPAAESLGGGTGVRVDRGGRGRRPREGNDEHIDDLNGQGNNQGMGANEGISGVNGNVEGANGGAPDFSTIIAQQLQDLLPAMLAQVGNQGNVGNQNDNVVNENVQENDRNVLVNGNRVGCSHKEFLACNLKEYDGKGGVVVLTRWIENIENVQDMSGYSIDQKMKYTAGSFVEEFCPSHEMQKLESELWNHAMVGAGHAAYTDRFHELASHEMQKLESELWNHAMVGAGHAAYTDRFHELARLVPHLVTRESRMIKRTGSIKKVEKRGNVGEPSKDKNGRDDKKRIRTVNVFVTTVNPVGRKNTGTWLSVPPATPTIHPEGLECELVNTRNPTVRVCYECGSADHVRPACLRLNRAQGPEGNLPNQVAANNGGQGHGNQGNQARGRAFMLGAVEARQDPNIVTGIKPSDLGFRYEIEIASGQLVEIDKVIKGCKLEIEGLVFDIDLIPFGHGSFDLKSAKAKDKKQREIVVVRDFSEVFPDDLFGLPPIWEIKFRIEECELVNTRNPTVRVCYECGSADHVRPACPRLNRAQGLEGNLPNQVDANNGGQGRGNQGNQVRGRAFMLGAVEARQDPNIVTSIKSSDLGFRYEIEIASGQLVEIDKVIKGCKLEIEGLVFDIDLIPFGHRSFDVIHGGAWVVVGWLLGGDVVVKVAIKVVIHGGAWVVVGWLLGGDVVVKVAIKVVSHGGAC
nr:hypothetical protein [Tanacetum cinerariifolium]